MFKRENRLYNRIFCPAPCIVHRAELVNCLHAERSRMKNASFGISVCKILNNWNVDKYFHEFMQIHAHTHTRAHTHTLKCRHMFRGRGRSEEKNPCTKSKNIPKLNKDFFFWSPFKCCLFLFSLSPWNGRNCSFVSCCVCTRVTGRDVYWDSRPLFWGKIEVSEPTHRCRE